MRTRPSRVLAALCALVIAIGMGWAAAPTSATPCAAIKGQVLSWMDPIGYARVTVFNADTGTKVKSALTDGEGRYLIGGLVPGRIKVRATKSGYLPSWASGEATWASADVYALAPGQSLEQTWDERQILYLDLTPESVITGDIMGFSYSPTTPWDDPLPGVRISVFDAATGRRLGSTRTDPYGHFRVGMLRQGTVKVRASKQGWVTTWAMNQPTWAKADVFALPPGSGVDVGMLSMYATAGIAGQVLSGMDPLAGGATVTVFNADTGRRLGSGVADPEGYYQIGGLPPARIKVRASKPGYIANWADSFGPQTWGTATVFTLVPGQLLEQSWSPLSLYLDIQREAVVSGRVLGDGDPLPYAKVTVFDAVTGVALRSTRADSGGYYRVNRIDAWGGRTIKVRAVKAGWAPSWADGKTSKATADTYFVYPGAVLSQSWDPLTLYLNLRPRS